MKKWVTDNLLHTVAVIIPKYKKKYPQLSDNIIFVKSYIVVQHSLCFCFF